MQLKAGVLCNNAGVALHGVTMQEISLADWDWVMAANIKGEMHAIHTLVSRMRAAGGPAHIVNTTSIGGFQVNPSFLTGA